MTLHVELVSPERILYEGEAEMVVARAVEDGDIAFLVGHTSYLGALDIAEMRIYPEDGGEPEHAAVHGGFISVQNDQVIVLSDIAELGSQIDADRARGAKNRIEAADRVEDDAEAEAALRRAHARLAAAGQLEA
jgi:F-type H+-transporting ATPase subunit epsilon